MCYNKGKVLIIAAPSGSGKTTIAKFLISKDLNLVFSISACNRKKRQHEIDGVDYLFLNTKEFKKKINGDAFLEWEEVYNNKFYGTLKKDVFEKLDLGKNILFDIDVKGAVNLKNFFKDQALLIYIEVPLDIIEDRLRRRSTETEEQLLVRLNKIAEEIKYKEKFDLVFRNNNLINTQQKIYKAASSFLKN